MQRAVSTLSALVARTIARHGMVRRGERVLVAVSGGSDSVGLLGILARLQPQLGIELVAAHVNHHLRGEDADEDERCAAENAERLHLAFVRADLPASLRTASNLEARARTLRYAALHRLAAATDCRKIATGHTRDDQAETLLLRLIRGSGPAGLASIQPRRRDDVIRPFIQCTRAQIEEVVRMLGLRYRTDTSNADPRFRRTRMRHDVLPLLRQLNANVDARLARAAALFDAERSIVAEWIGAQVERACDGENLDLARLVVVPMPLRGSVVRHWLQGLMGADARLTGEHVEGVVRLARGTKMSGTVALPGGRRIERCYDTLSLTSGQPSVYPFEATALRPGNTVTVSGWRITMGPVMPSGEAVRLPRDLWSAVCAVDEPPGSFAVRSPRVGDRVRPLGLGGTRKLSDVFTDCKIPGPQRRAYPVVECAEQILWVPGVVRSEMLLVGEDTAAAVSLSATREGGL